MPGYMAKDKVKLLLNSSRLKSRRCQGAGDIEMLMSGTMEAPNFVLRCRGTGARAPQHLGEFISGENLPALDALTIQAYYTWRLAGSTGMSLSIMKDGADVLVSAISA